MWLITLHGVRSKSLGRHKHSKGIQIFENRQTLSEWKLDNSEDMQAAIIWVAIEAAMAAVKERREADPTTKPHTRRNSQENIIDQGKLDQCWFNEYLTWKHQIPQMKTYNLNDEEKVSIIGNWLGHKVLHFMHPLTNAGKDTCKNATGLFNMLRTNSAHSGMKWCCHYTTKYYIENIMNQHGNGWAHCI